MESERAREMSESAVTARGGGRAEGEARASSRRTCARGGEGVLERDWEWAGDGERRREAMEEKEENPTPMSQSGSESMESSSACTSSSHPDMLLAKLSERENADDGDGRGRRFLKPEGEASEWLMSDSESSKSPVVERGGEEVAMEGERVRSVRLLVEEEPAREAEADIRSSSR
jgi:hypothetical protein